MRLYEMTSGWVAAPDGRPVNAGAVVTIRLTDADDGTTVAASALRRADGSAWPSEGVVADGDARVVVLWPAAPYPDVLWVDTNRGRWLMLPQDLSPRTAALEETAVRVDDDGTTLLAPDGTPISVGIDPSEMQATTIAEDEDTDTATVAFLLPSGKYLPYTGARVTAGGGTGGTYADKIVHLAGPSTMPSSAATWPAGVGAVPLAFSSISGHSAFTANAFGSGKNGITLDVDAYNFHSTFPMVPSGGSSRTNVAVAVMKTLGINDYELDGIEVSVLQLLTNTGAPLVRLAMRLHNDGTHKTLSWVVTSPSAGSSEVLIPNGGALGHVADTQVVPNAMVVELRLRGASSTALVNGATIATFSTVGLADAEYLDLNPWAEGSSPIIRGYKTLRAAGWGENMTEDEADAWATALGADVSVTI